MAQTLAYGALGGGIEVARVWALIYPPSYVAPEDSETLVVANVPQIQLTKMSSIYSATVNCVAVGQGDVEDRALRTR